MPSITKKILRSVFSDAPSKAFKKTLGGTTSAKKAWKGYKRQAMSQQAGPDSMVAWLPTKAAEKLLGKKRVRGASWKYVSAPAMKADVAVGSALQKIPGGKKLFTTTDQVPWGPPKAKMSKEVTRASALAPFTKLRDLSEPIIIGVGTEKALQKMHSASKGIGTSPQQENKGQGTMNKKASTENLYDTGFREKVASALVRLNEDNKNHEKRAHALKLLYKQAELGHSCVPQTYSELEEKLASLINQDLNVLEKALELTGGTLGIGEVAPKSDASALNADEKFQAAVIGESF